MRICCLVFMLLVLLAGCNRTAPTASKAAAALPDNTNTNQMPTLFEARKGFTSKLRKSQFEKTPVPEPPSAVFKKVQYDSAVGKLPAYLTPNPGDGKKHPAIVWITGGDCNSIDDGLWKDAPADNDQTASQYRKAGIVMMFPSLRGGNENPGAREGFLGEVYDVLSAADFLSKQDYVDPTRIYLGGHSTGGTLVLLTAEYSSRFRAVFSFGPVDDVRGYGPEYMPFENGGAEIGLRSPSHWYHSIKSPTFVIEGKVDGNFDCLQRIRSMNTSPHAHCLPVRGATHFSVLAPVNKLIAEKILKDTEAVSTLAITEDELNDLFIR